MSFDVCLHISDALGRYGFGPGHPFNENRMDAFWREAQRRGLHQQVEVLETRPATRAELARFHHPGHIVRVESLSMTGDGYLDQGDTPAFKGVFEAASHVVGATLDGLARIMDGRVKRAFVPIAGLHHARPDGAAGFCVFNDCGVVIATLREQYDIKKIAYVDIDAHHGDGVFYAFESDPDLIFADLHEDGHYLYPGTGAASEQGSGPGKGKKLNIPLPPQTDDKAFFQEWQRVEAFVREAEPDFILLQCGADSIRNDPLTHMGLTPAAHGHVAARLVNIADELGHGRVMAVGGGGYDMTNLAEAWCEVVASLVGNKSS
ncbi:MAG: acetoin utilization protein AcuC [Magnetococcales bacterium]|nr:acetoin utilization protein AcuC [Magnetococcales bacterium]